MRRQDAAGVRLKKKHNYSAIIKWCMGRSSEMHEAKGGENLRVTSHHRSFQSIRYQQLPLAALYTSGTCDLECWYNGWASKKSVLRANLFRERARLKGNKKESSHDSCIEFHPAYSFRRIYIAFVYASLCLHSNGKLLRRRRGSFSRVLA